MEAMLAKKVEAVHRLVDVAETAHNRHNVDEDLRVKFDLVEDEHFNYIPVNLTLSTVHVPTNVYDESIEVLNGVTWSEGLDQQFYQNYLEDPTLTWQYFGSSSGFFRTYPGIQWGSDGVDLFDCRSRGWYIQAATSPKDVVILLDASGSMKGLRMEIAKATINKILDTLSDDDFFNVIKFSDNPAYVDECFNGTLVQANADNKKRVKDSLQNVKTKNIAFFDRALIEAFDLLKAVNESGKGSQCNHAIMLITDGAPETYEELFESYNWPDKQIRIFTYLIGREVGDSRQVEWMACSNKGYFSHISTLADVHEHVQEYIHVLSRPMVIMRANHTIWTSVYVDEAGLEMMTSVAQPVFDTKNESSNSGILLGVVGTDVPLRELTKLTPQFKLGVNGYAFAITNNGYVLFHPDFRPTTKPNEPEIVKPNYNSVDLAEVEIAASNSHLRRRMVNRETGSLTMEVKMHYDDMKRITVRKNHYFFTDIEGTPFSLGIALPDGYGMNWLDGQRQINKDTVFMHFIIKSKPRYVNLVTRNYCRMDTNETRQDSVEMLLKYLELGKAGSPLFKEKCDEELIGSIIYDAEITRGALANWMKQNADGSQNEKNTRRNGIELVFIGTKGGLTRYHKLVDNLTQPDFMDRHSGTVEDLYYKRAAEAEMETFIFSIPEDINRRRDDPLELNNTMITASTPIKIKKDDKDVVAAVLGLQMRYTHFYDTFMKNTKACPKGGSDCDLTCESAELDCYLLDNNGFVVLSESPLDVGKFFGEIDGTLMQQLIVNEGSQSLGEKRGVYEKIELFDYQGICDIIHRGSSGANSIFIDPVRKLFSSLGFLMNELAIFLLEFNIMSWWNGGSSFVSGQSYSIQRVPRTNLLMLVVDALCSCGNDLTMMIDPVETEIHRMRPLQCFSQHQSENSSACGGAEQLQPPIVAMATLSILNLIFATLSS
ncbi:hypothetical protein CAPTEDRAFT_2293 [Capitella teleta]|uniref:VWFA domain-containing protein n=1 Tax=Capitella teleta TaxID=283909 RepID=R7UFB7_CAPTE|nr:hypothetical protein CAPTEDRAFT_2293 [Capitella teleta]|eukprot:ELU02468.1 hypothetical protein CAPTEDRAFT_2293 [Capitella teleta]